MKKMILAVLCLLPCLTMAIDYNPWYSRDLEIQPKAKLTYQNFHRINTPRADYKYNSQNYLLELSVAGAYSAYSIELETNFAKTRHRDFGYCDTSLTGRYQWLDDVVDDPVSLTTGVTLRQVNKLARHDISQFYHGCFEGEIHAAVGKETNCWEYWHTRLWGVLGFGFADKGAPAIRFNMSWDHNWWNHHQLNVFVNTLWGLGKKELHRHHFRGYGNVRHQSVDLGTQYSWATECFGVWSLGYTYRLYAMNCPRNVNQFSVSILYPFGV